MEKKYRLIYISTIIVALVVAGLLMVHPAFTRIQWIQPSVHSAAETLGVSCMIFLSFILMHQFSRDHQPWRFFVAVGLSGMGILEGFHAVISPGNQFVLFHLLASLWGSAWFMISGLHIVIKHIIVYMRGGGL